MIVSNASPIINFGKQGRLDILKKCFREIIIPKEVYREVISKRESPEAIALEKAIEEKWIKIKETDVVDFLNTKKIGKGEEEAISLAYRENRDLLIDDDSAKAYALILNVNAHGSLYVLLVASKKKIISKDEAGEIFERMIKNNFYVSTELYLEFFRLVEV